LHFHLNKNLVISNTPKMAINGISHHDVEDDIDYSDIEAKYQVQYDEGLDNVVVVDGVPVIDESKTEKLLARISKEFSKKGVQIKPDDMFVPWNDSNGKSKGYIIMEFKNADDAAYAIGVMNGHQFDTKHKFYLNRFTDIERYANLDATYVEPEPEPYAQKVCRVLFLLMFTLDAVKGAFACLAG